MQPVASAGMVLLAVSLYICMNLSWEHKLQLCGSKLLRPASMLHEVWTHSFGVDLFLCRQETEVVWQPVRSMGLCI